ncbi:MAG: hypothetical protein WDO73_26795 [Ignavibacteriota bacterium]
MARCRRRAPVLIVSYWLNYQMGGVNPFSFHLTNVMIHFVIHFVNSGLVFLVLLRILQKAGWEGQKPRVAAAIGALIFAIHPLQTESVSYVAGRSGKPVRALPLTRLRRLSVPARGGDFLDGSDLSF